MGDARLVLDVGGGSALLVAVVGRERLDVHQVRDRERRARVLHLGRLL